MSDPRIPWYARGLSEHYPKLFFVVFIAVFGWMSLRVFVRFEPPSETIPMAPPPQPEPAPSAPPLPGCSCPSGHALRAEKVQEHKDWMQLRWSIAKGQTEVGLAGLGSKTVPPGEVQNVSFQALRVGLACTDELMLVASPTAFPSSDDAMLKRKVVAYGITAWDLTHGTKRWHVTLPARLTASGETAAFPKADHFDVGCVALPVADGRVRIDMKSPRAGHEDLAPIYIDVASGKRTTDLSVPPDGG